LEAAHIDRFSQSWDDRVTKGILLRADLHRLVDAGLMTFEWSTERITARIHPSVKNKMYRDLDRNEVKLPKDRSWWPLKKCIDRHARSALGKTKRS
jgi:hypothetical protein